MYYDKFKNRNRIYATASSSDTKNDQDLKHKNMGMRVFGIYKFQTELYKFNTQFERYEKILTKNNEL